MIGTYERRKEMLKKVGNIAVDNQLDYYHEQIKALEEAGFTVILTSHTYSTDYFDIAREK